MRPRARSGQYIRPLYEVTDPGVSAATSTAIIDAYNGVLVTLTAAGNAQTLGSPTNTTAGQLFYFINNDTSTDSITVNGSTVLPGSAYPFLWDGTAWMLQSASPSTATSEPTGFENQTDSTLVWTDSTPNRTLTLTGTFNVRVLGQLTTVTGPDAVQITDTEGLWYIYYDSGGTLTATQSWSHSLFLDYAFVASIYWDFTNKTAIRICDERHGWTMSGETHHILHDLLGLSFVSGFGLGNIDSSGDGDTDSHAQFSVSDGEAHDEDLEVMIFHGTGSARFEQRLNLSNIAYLPVLYRDGADASDIWRKTTATAFPVEKGTNRLKYNLLSGGTWTQPDIGSNGNYVLAHIFATTDITEPIISIMGQAEYANRVLARDGADTELGAILLDGLPSREMLPLFTVIFQTSTGYGNTVAARVRPTNGGNDYVDWRQTNIGTGGISLSNHNALTSLQGGTTDEYYHLTSAEHVELNAWLDDVTLGATGDITTPGNFETSNNSATFTHSGTTSLTITSTSGTVIVEGATFNGTVVTGLTALTSTALTGTLQTAAQANVTSLGTLTSLNITGALDVNGHSAFGANAAVSATDIVTVTETTTSVAAVVGFNSTITVTVAAPTSASYTASRFSLNTTGAQTYTSSLRGAYYAVSHSGTSTCTEMIGGLIAVSKWNTGSVSTAYGMSVGVGNFNATGTITNAYGYYLQAFTMTGVITNAYGIKISNVSGAATINRAIETGTGDCLFGDDVAITGNLDVSGHSAFGASASVSATSVVYINETTTSTSATNSINNIFTVTPSAGNASAYKGISQYVKTTGGYTLTGSLQGTNYTVIHDGTATLSYLYGNILAVKNTNTGTVNTIYSEYISSGNATAGGSVGTSYSIYLESIAVTGPVTNAIALKIANISGAATVNRAIETGTGDCLFGDDVAITGDLDVAQHCAFGNAASVVSDFVVNIVESSTSTSAIGLINNELTVTPSGDTAAEYISFDQVVTSAGSYNLSGYLMGISSYTTHNGTGQLDASYGNFIVCKKANTGAITTIYGNRTICGNYNAVGTVTDVIVSSIGSVITTGTVTNAYGLRIDNISGAATINRAIQTGTGDVVLGCTVLSVANLASGATQVAAGAAAGELWHDTDDDTIKMGV
jgi:hypothetical protein